MTITNALTRRPGPKMSASGSDGPPPEIAYEYRRIVGAYLRDRRLDADLTQRELADSLGVINTFISSYEVGRTSVPPEHFEPLGKLLGLDPVEFAKFLLRYTNPWLWLMLFDPDDKKLRIKLAKLSPRAGRTL